MALPYSFVNDEGDTIHYFKHTIFDTPQGLQASAEAAAARSKDAYFALGSVKEKLKKGLRKKPNIDRLRCFWLDLDVKDSPNHYASQKVAMTALKGFIKANGLPLPTVVNSGGGLHVYWAMTESIDRPQWDHYAAILKAATQSYGLLADPSRTSDCCSVLRVPDTLNFKTDPGKPVAVVMAKPPTTPVALLSAIANSQYDMAKISPKSSIETAMGARPDFLADEDSDVNKEATGGLTVDMTEAKPKPVVRRCQQLLWQAQNPTAVEEPQWYDMVGCLRHAEDGAKAVHAMSMGYPGYKKSNTDAKIQQHVEADAGPTLCTTFESHRPGGCAGCPHAGKISTPLQLGKTMKAAPTPDPVKSAVVGGTPTALPEPAYPFKRVTDKTTGMVAIALAVETDGGQAEETVIYAHDIYPVAIIYDERENKYVVHIRRYLPKDGWETFPIPLGKFYDKRSLSITLGDLGIMPDLGKVELLVQYMIGYIQQLQRHAQAAIIYAQLGWRDETRFVLGDRVVYADKVEVIEPHRNIVNALGWSEPVGDLAGWRTVMAMYEKPGMEAFQFAAGVAWAAPLFRFTNFNGMIVSMVGEKGCGKSSVMHLVNSVWGHKSHSWVDLEHDTQRAFYNKLGVLKNLPVCYDEVTNLGEEALSDLCYAISKGQGRQRLNQDGSAKENHGNWQTMMLTTSNASLHGRLANAKSDASAEAVRVFEYYIPSGLVPKREADETLDLLNYHNGVAGEIFAQHVLGNLDSVKLRIKYWTREMELRASVTSGERFWAAGPACILAGYEVANACGLTQVDVDKLATFSVRCILSMRGTVEENIKTPNNILAEYFNSSFSNMLVLNSGANAAGFSMVAHEPRNELRIRYETHTNTAWLDQAHFREFCANRGVDWSRLKADLRRQGILQGEPRTVLGKGTSWKTAQTRCWKIDMSHPEMAGSAQTSSLNANEVAHEAVAKAQSGGW